MTDPSQTTDDTEMDYVPESSGSGDLGDLLGFSGDLGDLFDLVGSSSSGDLADLLESSGMVETGLDYAVSLTGLSRGAGSGIDVSAASSNATRVIGQLVNVTSDFVNETVASMNSTTGSGSEWFSSTTTPSTTSQILPSTLPVPPVVSPAPNNDSATLDSTVYDAFLIGSGVICAASFMLIATGLVVLLKGMICGCGSSKKKKIVHIPLRQMNRQEDQQEEEEAEDGGARVCNTDDGATTDDTDAETVIDNRSERSRSGGLTVSVQFESV